MMAKKMISLDRLQEFTELKDHFEIVHPLTILVTSHEYSDKKKHEIHGF
jgi:hypothetical protein